MQLWMNCPCCQSLIRTDGCEQAEKIACENCDWSRPIVEGDITAGQPTRCLGCGSNDLWRQKDFPQGLGVLFVALGALLSTIAWFYMWPVVAIGILMVFALADLLLYALMNDVLVCYRCNARHRHAIIDGQHARFDLETAERYRQEAIRLNESTKAGGG